VIKSIHELKFVWVLGCVSPCGHASRSRGAQPHGRTTAADGRVRVRPPPLSTSPH
jgi:hypothetical protein